MLQYWNGKGWNTLCEINQQATYYQRTDIGAVNTYRFFASSAKTSRPTLTTWSEIIAILVSGYSEYLATFTTTTLTGILQIFFNQKTLLVSDTTYYSQATGASADVLIDLVSFCNIRTNCIYHNNGGVSYDIQEWYTIETKNANNQGVYVAANAANINVAPDTSQPVTVNMTAGPPVINVPIADLVTSNEEVAAKQLEILNNIQEAIASHGQLTDAASADVSDFLRNLFTGLKGVS